MRASIFLLLLVLVGVASPLQTERAGLTVAQVQELLQNTHTVALLHVRTKACGKGCKAVLDLMQNHGGNLKSFQHGLELITTDATLTPDLLEELGVTADSGLFYIFRGQVIRVDEEDDPTFYKDVAKGVEKTLRAVPIELTLAMARNPSGRFINVFSGGKTSKYFQELELVSKATKIPIYYSTNNSLTEDLDIEKKLKFYTRDTQTNTTTMMEAKPTYENILRFLSTSNKPLPQVFDLEKLRKATHSMTPVVVFRGGTKTSEGHIIDTVCRDLEEIVRNHFQVFNLGVDSLSEEASTIKEFCTDSHHPSVNTLCILENNDGNLVRYIYKEGVFEIGLVQRFMERFIEGSLTPYIMHEKIGKEQRTTPNGIRNLNSIEIQGFLAKRSGDKSHRAVLYYSSSQPNKAVSEAMDYLAGEYSKGEVILGRVDMDKNELVGGESHLPNTLVMNGGKAGKSPRHFTGPWENKTALREWVQRILNPNHDVTVHEEIEEVSISEQGRASPRKQSSDSTTVTIEQRSDL